MPTMTTLVDGTVPVAADFNGNFQALNNALGTGTTISSYTTGDMLYATAANTLGKLGIGATNGSLLGVSSGVPAWNTMAWTTPAFSAGDFTASGSMTWTVAAGDVTTFAYLLLGKTMIVNFNIATTTVAAPLSSLLKIKIPASQIAAKTVIVPIYTVDNNAAPGSPGFATVTAAGTTIDCAKDTTQSNWSASTDLTYVRGSITFEVQ